MTKKVDDDAALAALPNVRFRTAYDKDTHIRIVQEFAKPERTKPEFKDSCDVNKIVNQFMRTGNADLLNQAKGMYLDLSTLPDNYQDALNLVIRARDAFDTLPAEVRAGFNNDVSAFLAAAHENPDAVFGAPKPTDEESAKATTAAPGNPDPSPAPPEAKTDGVAPPA